ncbi:nucleotidyltransferase family protein [Acetobacter sp.]|uniref:nucleotidyltransferase family protein n=1 Tax=Acetobacter sp. TaxID=440 RepID=UPI0039ECAE8B
MTDLDFIASVLKNPFNKELFARLGRMGLPECYLTAGCLFQTKWNEISGCAPDWGIKDYDVFYFDKQDLSWEAEDQVVRRVTAETTDLPIKVEIKNQARVHLWYSDRFGGEYPQLQSARAGIDLYLISCTSVGIEIETGNLYAPNGLGDLNSGVLCMNPRNPKPNLFRHKAESYRKRWPWLQIIEGSCL